MRAKRTMRVPTAAQLAVGASVLAFPVTALAVTTSSSQAAATTPSASLRGLRPLSGAYGAKTVVRGYAPRSAAGTPIELEYRAAGARRWRAVDFGQVRRNGRFSLSAHLSRSGSFRVAPAPPAPLFGDDTASVSSISSDEASSSTAGGLAPTAIQTVTIAPELKLATVNATAVAGQATQVRGTLLPGIAGRRLELEVQDGSRWVPVAATRTGRGGAFDISYVPGVSASEKVQVLFAGDPRNSAVTSAPASVTEMEYAEVSWYDDAGDTACGFHATYGIASRTLPCGTKVTISYAGRTVVATVDDRGPFVYSRLYDLNQNVASALGMYGVATVLASV